MCFKVFIFRGQYHAFILGCICFISLSFLSSKLAALGVSPTLLSLSPEAPIANLIVSNEKDSPTTMQVEVVRWMQKKGKDEYKSTEDIIASPLIFTVPAQGKQVIRFGLERPIFGPNEKGYRIFIQEVVPVLKQKNQNLLQISLRVSLPLIVRSQTAVMPSIYWQTKAISEGKVRVTASNNGNNIIFINQLQALSSKSKALSKPLNTFAYLLPGSQKTWTIETRNIEKVSLIKASINNQITFSNVSQ
jgi:fimbrial chaperone protein